MPDQNRVEAFHEAKAVVEARHQEAVRAAHIAFDAAVAEIERERLAQYREAERRWNEVKASPEHPEHDQRRAEFDRAKEPADHGPARQALAEALVAADNALHHQLREIAAEHGVLMSTAG